MPDPSAEPTLRPATIDDAEAVADVATALWPDDPVDPLILRHHWLARDPGDVVERFAVLAGGRVVGVCTKVHSDWAKVQTRYGRVEVILHPDLRSESTLTWAFDRIEDRSREDGTEILRTWGRDD